jgi:predicted secreted protein
MLTLRPLRLVALVSSLTLVAGLAVAGATGATAASPAKKDTTLIVRDLPAQVRLVPGEKVKIILQTNLTTGYTWTAEGGCCTPSGAMVAKVSDGTYKAPANTGGMVGVPGTTTWVVTALRPGRTSIQIITSPPGAKNTMNDETVGTLKLIVMPK